MASPSPAERDVIRFVLDGEVIELRDIDPTLTVLRYLREYCRRTGTKEGCAEGDCGACTVVLGELHGSHLRFRAVNACIQFVPTLDGKALITVESLKTRDGRLHPVQQAMIECHASQCGFCTPGFVMSLYALYKTESDPTREQIQDALAGNLCRCTGSRPIIDAAQRMYHLGHSEDTLSAEDDMIGQLQSIQQRHAIALRRHRLYFAPSTIDDLTALCQRYPEAHLLAGGTDVGLWVTKQHQHLDVMIYLGRVEPLTQLNVTHDAIEVGAAVPLTDVHGTLLPHYPMLDELWRRRAPNKPGGRRVKRASIMRTSTRFSPRRQPWRPNRLCYPPQRWREATLTTRCPMPCIACTAAYKSAGKTTSISKARLPWPCRRKTGPCWSTVQPSTRARCNRKSRVHWERRCTM
jgi:xanthine dehydrogenase small subunit